MKNKLRKNKQHSYKKQRLLTFYFITACIPVLFFLILELSLRLAGFGRDVPLFIENPAHPSYQLPRPDVMTRYFPENAPKPSVTMEANFILKDKPENGYRVIVQGGSTAAGFPYGLGASIAGTLDQRLKASMPGRHVEVLNTAMSAVNSYTLLDFSDEIIEQQPDAVLIYAGHNEFLGILGVGSNYTAMGSGITTQWFLSLKDVRIFQLIQQLYFALAADAESEALNHEKQGDTSEAQTNNQRSRTFMAKVAKNKAIPFDSSVYRAGLKQFENNMSSLLRSYRAAGIQVYISTIASNLSNQAPFASLPLESELQATANALFAGSTRQHHQSFADDLQKASAILSKSASADLHFKVGTLALELKQIEIAKKHFELALEHDQLRFRAPLAINNIIRRLANQYDAVLVDSYQELSIRSPNGIVGNTMMLEHLHPNLQGYFVISNAFYESMLANEKVRPFLKTSIERAWAERLVLPQEEYYGFATILNLMSDYPFTSTPQKALLPKPADWQQQLGQDFFLQKISWLEMMEKSLNRYKNENNQIMMAKTIQILADALPHNGLYNLQIAEMKYQQRRFNESLHYYQRAKLAGAIGSSIDNNILYLKNALSGSTE
jgi:lysophospholipase L1-like esterase